MKGGEAVIESLYNDFYPELTGWCYTITGNAALTEDLLQEAWLRAMSNESLLTTLGHNQQRAWLYRTIKNLYVDHVRHASFETLPETMPETSGESEQYTDIDCEQLLDILPDEERVLFVMRYFYGYTSSELGRQFGLPPGTIRSRLSSARKRLRNIWPST